MVHRSICSLLLLADTIDYKCIAILAVVTFLKVIVRFEQDSLIHKIHLIHEALHVVKVFSKLHDSLHP